MEKEIRMRLKVAFIIALLLLLCFFMGKSVERKERLQEEEMIKTVEVKPLLSALFSQRDNAWEQEESTDENLTYGTFVSLMQACGVDEEVYIKYETNGKKRREMAREEWFAVYDELLKRYGLTAQIEETELTLLEYGKTKKEGGSEENAEEKGTRRADYWMLAAEGEYTYVPEMAGDALEKIHFQKALVYRKEGMVLGVRKIVSKEVTLSNVWINEVDKDGISCYVSGRQVQIPYVTDRENREQVADILFENGQVKDCLFKRERTGGRLLAAGSEGLEIEGKGVYSVSEDIKVYKLYGPFMELGLGDLEIGGKNTDYVIEDGKVCACLITGDEGMERIRVLLQAGNYAGSYHEKVVFSADSEVVLSYGEKEERYGSGEVITITPDSAYFKEGNRMRIQPEAQTGRILLSSIERAQGPPSYRGALEIAKVPEGLVVINELLLEEYLYAVVPSEMPASYPLEALKAQAVCARTYAYRNMKKAGLPGLGAHVDDSTAFQVYNNGQEHEETTRAVKETNGKILYYDGELVEAYYYSTSCGYGADGGVWKGQEADSLPYLCAKSIEKKAEASGTEAELSAEKMQEEDVFEAFILSGREENYERNEPWYRWNYVVNALNPSKMQERLQNRYAVSPNQVLTKKTGTDIDYISQPVEDLGDIRNISVQKRNKGGNIDELLIEGTECTVLVLSEYSVRYVLCDGETKVIRQDGSEAVSPTLLPSAFCMITALKEADNVIGYTVIGGGYGHGVGMSQNGAKNMALEGMTQAEILSFFYEGSRVESVY